ncbi:MAG TPA: universal stress protein [Pyrinomonadaceae bacterium]|jgi:nucleotide-binding universal stress UspA family protein
MYPFRNILFPTDFTPHARAALKYAAAFAHEGGGRIVLFSVQSGSVPANLLTLPERVLEEPDQRWLQQLRVEVRNLLEDPMFDGLEVEPVIIEGEPAPEIARAVREFDIDLVTIVTHGRRGLARAVGFDRGGDYRGGDVSCADDPSAAARFRRTPRQPHGDTPEPRSPCN